MKRKGSVKANAQEEAEGSSETKLVIPKRYLCALTNKIMKDPVKAHDKLVYEREVIFSYLEKHRESFGSENTR